MVSEITTSLEVWLLNQRAGTLWLKAGELQFQYSAQWLEQPQTSALSQSLPLQAEPFGDQACWPFFAGLLPEGQLRQPGLIQSLNVGWAEASAEPSPVGP